MYKRMVLFVMLITAALALRAQTPMQYNNKLVTITDSLNAKGTRWSRTFREVKVIKEFGDLAPYRKDLEQYIDSKIAELKADGDVSGSGELKKAVLEFLNYERNMVHTYFAAMESFSETSTDEEIKAAIQNLSAEAQKENSLLTQVNQAQDAYARKNNFNIDAPAAGGKD